MPTIQIDKREPLDKICPIIEGPLMVDRFKDIEVIYKSMQYGDYLISEGNTQISVERKTISDFVNSYGKGNLKEKLFAMRLANDRTMLLLEGHPKLSGDRVITFEKRGKEYGLDRKTMLRFLINQQDKGTFIWFTNDLHDTLYQVFLMAENLAHMGTPTPTCKCGNPRELLLQINGLGDKKLAKIMADYKSPSEALAYIADWQTPTIKKALDHW